MFSYPKQVGGVLTRILQAGLQGETVVLVHGTGARADRWIRNLEPLAEAGFKTYALDLPGHGFAEKNALFDHSVRGYAEFLSSFVEGLDTEKVTLVGTSLGGHVVATYATLHPKKVKAVVLVGSMGLVPVGEETRLRIQAGAINQERTFVGQKLRRVIADTSLITESFIEEEFTINNSAGAAEALQKLGQYIATNLDRDVIGDQLNGLPPEVPILLIWGDQDKTVPLSIGIKAHELVARSTLAVIRDVAHTSYFEDPLSFNRLLIDFMCGEIGKNKMSKVEYL
jgi:2-hydroxy-6-oxonona-2,4-dienedioate hydrolase